MHQIRGGLWWMRLSGWVGTIGCSLSMWNGSRVCLQQIIVLDWSISQPGLTSAPEEWARRQFFHSVLPRVTKHWRSNWCRHGLQQLFVFILMKDEIVLTNDYISQRGPYLSAFEANIATKFGSPLRKWETVCRQRSSPFLSSIEFSPTKDALLIDWATHFPCIKLFAVWGAQFVSALVNRLKAAASP